MAEPNNTPLPIRRKDYRPPDFLVPELSLTFRLDARATRVVNELRFTRNEGADPAAPLVLDGQHLRLVSLHLDGAALPEDRYRTTDDHLIIERAPDAGTLRIETVIDPAANTALEGLYLSSGTFCTQCEAEGFRRITYHTDRPDVMSRYRVRIEAERARCPVLLANGNRIETGALSEGWHVAVWDDPHPKPSYLFALVAGDLGHIHDTFTTQSGRGVDLLIYTEHANVGRCAYAMEALKRAMRWDETRFGLEYDLEIFNIVAVNDFNMGAMENKSLNVFNTKYVLADPESATDSDFMGVEAVIAHEYFHNWTGNRITCRDWFQLTLKEGLTVFRDQEFTADLHSRPVKRIQDVKRLRAAQFPEDSGPTAHPIRPDSYIEINNFYTPTVYEKGAEVIRMIHTLIGEAAFQAGMRLYVERFDNQAVTCEDFLRAMEGGSGRDLGQFRRWYEQAGTPVLKARGHYEARSQRYTLVLEQAIPPTPGQADKHPCHLPVRLGLLDPDGRAVPLQLAGENRASGEERVLEMHAASETFTFVNVAQPPVVSLLRGFSAPVRLQAGDDAAALRHLLRHDPDPFARFDAGQTFAANVLLARVQGAAGSGDAAAADGLIETFAAILDDAAMDRAFKALLLTLPSESYLAQQMTPIDVDGIHEARESLRAELAAALHDRWQALYAANDARDAPFSLTAEAMARRQLKNLALSYLTAVPGGRGLDLAREQFATATTMTETVAALALLVESEHPARHEALEAFYRRWQDNALVIDKWFSLQAIAQRANAPEQARALLMHEAFVVTNPNRVRALIGAFAAGNPTGFHRADGAGYRFVAEQIAKLNELNPQVAARLTSAFGRWQRYDQQRQRLMRGELIRLRDLPNLSRDVGEIVTKSLSAA